MTHRYNDPICFLQIQTPKNTNTHVSRDTKQKRKKKGDSGHSHQGPVELHLGTMEFTPSLAGHVALERRGREEDVHCSICAYPSLCSAMLQRANEVTPRCTPPPSPVLLPHLRGLK